jgi:hypothetical protein
VLRPGLAGLPRRPPLPSGERPLRLRGYAVPAGRPSTKQGHPQARASCATDQAPNPRGLQANIDTLSVHCILGLILSIYAAQKARTSQICIISFGMRSLISLRAS